jgi:hypothetical protein
MMISRENSHKRAVPSGSLKKLQFSTGPQNVMRRLRHQELYNRLRWIALSRWRNFEITHEAPSLSTFRTKPCWIHSSLNSRKTARNLSIRPGDEGTMLGH